MIMIPAIHLHTHLTGSALFKHLLSIVSSHQDRLADLESLISNRLDDQFDAEDPDSRRDTEDNLSSEDGI